MSALDKRAATDRRGLLGTTAVDCPSCGATGARSLSEIDDAVHLGCPACRHVWTMTERRRTFRRHDDRREWDVEIRLSRGAPGTAR